MMRGWVTFVSGHPWPVIVAVVAVTIGFGWRLDDLQTDIRLSKLLPPHHPYVQIHNKVEREFGGRNLAVLAVVPADGNVWRPEVLHKVKAITDDVLRLPGVIASNVTSLSAPSARTFADRDGRIDIEYLMREVPETREEIEALRQRVERVSLFRGLLVTEDGAAALVMLDFWPDQDEHTVADAVRAVAAKHSEDPIPVYWAGTTVVIDAISREVERTQIRFLISFFGIATILYVTFGSAQGMIIPLTTAVLAVIWGTGLMAWVEATIDGWTVMTPVLVLAVAAGHSAQMLKRYYEEYERLGDNHAAVVESTARIGTVMLAAGATASLGFLSLLIFRVPSLQAFAIFTAWGISSAVILELTFIPALRSLLPAPVRSRETARAASLLARALERTSDWTRRDRAPVVLTVWAVLVVVAVAGIFRIEATASFESFIPPDSPVKRNIDAVTEHFRGSVPMVVELEGEEGRIPTPETLRYMADLSADLEKSPVVERVLSAADVLAYVNGALGPDGREEIPADAPLVSQLLFLSYSEPYERFLDRSYRRAAIWAYLRTDDTTSIDRAIRRAQAFTVANPPPTGVEVLIAGGMGPAVVAINEETTQGKIWNVAVIYLVIFAVGALLFRSLAAGALIVVPLFVSFVANLGILGWGRIDLDLTTSTILAIGVGIGADYAIYLLSRIREEVAGGLPREQALRTALLTSGKAVWFVAFAVGGGYVLLSPFGFLPLRLFGILIPTTMFVACSSAVTLIPAILSLVGPRFLTGLEAPEPLDETELAEPDLAAGGSA